MTDLEWPIDDDHLMASDGLPARRQKVYAKAKLDFLDYFMPPALDVVAGKRHRVYLDLFAGPGRNKDPETGEEFEGSPIRALRLRGRSKKTVGFTRTIFCNNSELDNAVLGERYMRGRADQSPHGPGEIEFVDEDCSSLARTPVSARPRCSRSSTRWRSARSRPSV